MQEPLLGAPGGRRSFVIGVGMTPFSKPDAGGPDYPDLAGQATSVALEDAGLAYEDLEQACVGYVTGDSACGQRALYASFGLTGLPVFNVNNNCASGSTALVLARQLVEGGIADVALALGFEKMTSDSARARYDDRARPLDRMVRRVREMRGLDQTPFTAQMFAKAAQEHSDRYGTTREQFARVAVKNHRHSVHNPFAQFQREYTLEEVLSSRMVSDPLTLLQCCPTSTGAAAAVVVSEDVVQRLGRASRAVEIVGQAMVGDTPATYSDGLVALVGHDMTRRAATLVYEATGYGPEDVDVIELHDCFSSNELITYEALSLCPEGQGGKLIDEGATTYGGQWVVNPSGGLLSKGHPLGATGVAQCAELVWQLRGDAGDRQVPGARVALQHNAGGGGVSIVTMYRNADDAAQEQRRTAQG